jgi:acetyltransferase-like isoleucine patch superfamily enzyme
VQNISVPAPRFLAAPFALSIVAIRWVYYFIARVAVCEPFFKAHCTKYGRNLHTGVYLHWIIGRGYMILGDNVTIDGKCAFLFAASFTERPTLVIGDNSGIDDQVRFVVGKQITIGQNCRIGSGVTLLDHPGHPLDPARRRAEHRSNRALLTSEDVKPIVIENNVFIGLHSIIMPGVTIGHDSVVAIGSVVTTSVPPCVLVAGNPARQVRMLVNPESS